MKGYPSLEASTQALKLFFSRSPDSDVASVEEICIAAGRNLSDPERNKVWLRNRLTPLKFYGFIEPVYAHRGGPLKMVRLTRRGREALDAPSSSLQHAHQTALIQAKDVSLESIARDIRQFTRQNPSIEIEINVSIKKAYDE